MRRLATLLTILLATPPAQAAWGRVEISLLVANQTDGQRIVTAVSTYLIGKSLPNCSASETN